jgi:hypothetical protein
LIKDIGDFSVLANSDLQVNLGSTVAAKLGPLEGSHGGQGYIFECKQERVAYGETDPLHTGRTDVDRDVSGFDHTSLETSRTLDTARRESALDGDDQKYEYHQQHQRRQ